MKYEPIYMQKRPLAFLRAWPDVPEELRPAHSLFFDAGMLDVDPAGTNDPQIWPANFRLTELGREVKGRSDSQSINFFRLEDLLDLISVDELSRRGRRADSYLKLFQTSWNDVEVRRYLAVRGADKQVQGLKASMARLEAAFDELIQKLLP